MSVQQPVPPAARQARSRRTQRALLDAGLRLLEEEGPEALTIAAVSARAGVTPGTVYRRFGDKDRLLAALVEEFSTVFRGEYGQRMSRSALPAGAGPRAAIDLAVRALADTFAAHETLLRVFVVIGLRDERTAATGRRASQEGGRLFRELLWPFRSSFPVGDPEHAIDVAHRLVYGTCLHRVLHGASFESPTTMTWDELADELSGVVALRLLTPPVEG